MANFDPSQNRNPWADCNKIPHNWLRPQEDPLNQIWYESIHWGYWAYGWNITFLCLFYLFIYLFIYTFFLRLAYRSTGWWIFTRDSSLHVKSRKDLPFGVWMIGIIPGTVYVHQDASKYFLSLTISYAVIGAQGSPVQTNRRGFVLELYSSQQWRHAKKATVSSFGHVLSTHGRDPSVHQILRK